MTSQTIDTGDDVLVKTIGETWTVAYCHAGRVCCCGWPCSIVSEADCELVRKATPEEKEELIQHMARMQTDAPSYYDSRKSYATNVLRERSESTQGASI